MMARSRPAGSWFDRLERVVDVVAALFLLVTLATSVHQVVSRYLLARPLAWSETLAGHALVWATLLGTATAFRRHEHFALETILTRRLPPALLRVVQGLIVLAFSGFLLWAGWQQTRLAWPLWIHELGIRQSALYVAVPVAAILIGLFTLERLSGRRTEARHTPTDFAP